MQWLLVYICEAHASDEWPIGSQFCVEQHKTVQERAAAATECLDALDCQIFPTVLDSMENSFNELYACWPLRYYLIDNGVIEHVPQPKGAAYNVLEIDHWLRGKLSEEEVEDWTLGLPDPRVIQKGCGGRGACAQMQA